MPKTYTPQISSKDIMTRTRYPTHINTGQDIEQTSVSSASTHWILHTVKLASPTSSTTTLVDIELSQTEILVQAFAQAKYKVIPRPPSSSHKLRRRRFEFTPKEPKHHFLFRFLNNVPLQHAREHSCFCKLSGCPWHNYY